MENFFISEVSNNTSCKRKEIKSMADLEAIVTTKNWSSSLFKSDYRTARNFLQSHLMVLDVDDGCSLDQATQLFKDYKHVIGITRSHQQYKNGIICDRFRVILFLENPIRSNADFKSTWNEIQKQYPFVDGQCSDSSRQWYPCHKIESVNSTGKLVPVTRGSTSNQVNNRKKKNTILDSMRFGVFGAAYYPRIYKYLYRNLDGKKISVAQVARFIANRVTGFKTGRERINQPWLAKHFEVNQSTASRLIKKLIELRLIAVSQLPTTGFDSTAYKAGIKLKEILKVRSTSAPIDTWKDGTAHAQMLKHIQWCFQNGYSKDQALKFCLKMQGQRLAEKMRSQDEIRAVIDNWWTKAAKKAGAA